MSSARAFCFSGNRGVVNPHHDITMNTAQAVISRRQKTAGNNHHLWNNHGRWWFHATFHLADGTAERLRLNLQTGDLFTARGRRDAILVSRDCETTRNIAA